MASGRRRSSSCFDNLPDDILRRIETPLRFKDRLAFFSCCRALRAYQTAATGVLWPEVQFRLRRRRQAVQSLAAWLARNRQHVGALKFEASFLPHPKSLEPECIVAAMKQSGAEAAQSLMPVLCALAGSSAHTLSVEVPQGCLDVGSWVLRLPQLESLFLRADELRIAGDLSPLTRLTTLSFESAQHMDIPAAMPAHLRELTLMRFNATSFGACAMAAGAMPHLQALMLGNPDTGWGTPMNWDWLPLRTSLTALTLSSWTCMCALPEQLAALTGLQQLAVRHSFFLPATEAAVEPLSALTRLTSLDLSWLRWESIPASVFALPSLKELDVTFNKTMTEPSIALAGSSSLTKLVADPGLVLGAPRQLARFPALHTLRLVFAGSACPWSEVEVTHEAVELLLGELSRLPRFAVLDLSRMYLSAREGFASALEVLGREHPFEIVLMK